MYTPKEIAANYIDIAKSKTSAKWYKTLVLAVLAGMFIALAGALATVAGASVDAKASLLVKAAVFPLGLILVVLAGSELFTGNCLLLAPTLSKDIKISAVLKNLGIVYGGNLVGSVLVALVTVYGGTFGDGTSIILAANAKCSMTFAECLLRAIPCNILVCLAVWISMASKTVTGKILAVYLPIFAFVACGFEHSVANMFYLSAGFWATAKYGVTAENLTAVNALVNNLLPATIGNVIGGTVFVALPYWFVYLKKDKNSENK
ncbi:MAG: formate/nitrite transporter family protein [Corallococcus sp.]|nr:formate/nitrite transporter family protein [Corallococcus sp.]